MAPTESTGQKIIRKLENVMVHNHILYQTFAKLDLFKLIVGN